MEYRFGFSCHLVIVSVITFFVVVPPLALSGSGS